MDKHFHVVAISTKRYHLISSHGTLSDAVKDILGRSYKSFGCVLRDGTTGRRYTVSECRRLSKAEFVPQPHRHPGPVAGCKECIRESRGGSAK